MKKFENRVSFSPQYPCNGLCDNDLDDFSQSSRDKTGTNNSSIFLSGNSLYEAVRELSERKKMSFFQPIEHLHYRTCVLTEGPEWFISYYVTNPETGKLKRIRMKVNRISNLKERRKAARQIMTDIDKRLMLGWNPLLERKGINAPLSIADALDAFLKVKEKETEKDSMRSYASFVKTFKTWLDANGIDKRRPVSIIDENVAKAFLKDVEAKVGARTYNNYVAFFRILFGWIRDRGNIIKNPFEGIEKKSRRLTKKTRRILNDEELETLMAFLQGQDVEFLVICMLCYCCFIRPKEIALLRCKDINLEKQLVHISAQIAKNDNDSYRTIPNDLAKMMRNLDLSHPSWYLFGQNDGMNFKPSRQKVCSRKIATWWNNVVRPACGFDKSVQFYSLKDTGITNMLGAGVPINAVQQQADHSSVAMTAIYVGRTGKASETIKDAHF